MKKRAEINKSFSSAIIALAILLLLFTGACKNDGRKGLIPEKTFARILYEVHLADGLISLPDIHDTYYPRDSLANYTDIFESHGYTKEAMDRTMKYYFTQKPKKLIRIYDYVIGILTEMELMLEKITDDIPSAQGGLWKGSQLYHIAGVADTAKLYFDHIFYAAGDYTMTFTLTLFPSDQSLNPRLTAFTCRADSLVTGRRNFISGIKYIKDGQPHTYRITFRIPDNLPLLIKGRLIDFENNPTEILRYVKIENISFVLSSLVR